MIDLIDFTSQAEDDGGRNVGMHQHAAERAAELIDIRAEGMAAAFAVRKGDDPIDVRRQSLAGIGLRDQFRGVRGAITGRDDRDVVARADPAILALIPQKGRHVAGSNRQRRIAGRELIAQLQFFKREVVGVDMASRFDGDSSAPNGLPIAAHGFAFRDRLQRDLVSSRHGIAHRHAHLREAQFGSGRQRHPGHRYVVRRMEADDGILRRRQLRDIQKHSPQL